MTAAFEPGLRVHAFLPASRANGPGLRAVVWTQGCSLGCRGCFNPETHPFAAPSVAVDQVFRWIVEAPGIEGLTVSGGEPLQQWPAVRALLQRIRAGTDLSVLLFSGYAMEEIRLRPSSDVVAYVDVLVAGRYVASVPARNGLVGSANQVVHLLTDRYTHADIDAVPSAEVVIATNGDVVVSGIGPPSRYHPATRARPVR